MLSSNITNRHTWRLLAAAMLANNDAALATRLDAWRAAQTASVAETPE
jgi:5-(carboxyamino)imidazole ribonucleotide mutase